MIFPDLIFKNKRVIATLTIILVTLGLLSLRFVPKAEDPRLPNWWAVVTVVLPGGAPTHIDDTIAQPLLEKLRGVDELKKIETSVKPEVMVMQLEMRDSIYDTEGVWNKVRERINQAKIDFPKGTLEPVFDNGVNDLETILIAVHGESDVLKIKDAARDLKHRLLTVPGASKVIVHGDPKPEVQISLNESLLKEKSISRPLVFQKVQDRNSGIPAGAINISGRQIQLQLNNTIKGPEDLQEVTLPLGGGEPSSLAEVSKSSWGAKRNESGAFFNGERAIFLGVVAQHPIEIVDFGKRVRELIATTKIEGIKVSEISFNPDRTEERLSDLGLNLLIGVITVGGILSLWMGWRIAFLVTLFLPVISIIAFQIYSLSGGILHQISLAAFVISLGQFVDNIIVIVESIQRKIDEGMSSLKAAYEVIDHVKRPMFFATGTNMAAFIPMAASSGATAEFTNAIPMVALLTLVCAYILSIFAVPLLAHKLLKPAKANATTKVQFDEITNNVARFITSSPIKIILLSAAILSTTGAGFVLVKQQFFPSADRNQFIVNIELQQSSSIKETMQASKKVQQFLLSLPEVEKVGGFVGEPVPLFYYNTGVIEVGKHISQLIVITKDKAMNDVVADKLKKFAHQEVLDARVHILRLEQGPPIQAPIEYRLFAEDNEVLGQAVSELDFILAANDKVETAKHSLGDGLLTAAIQFNGNLGERFGVDSQSLALNFLTISQGLEVGKVFKGGEALSLRLEGPEPTDYSIIEDKYVAGSNYRDLSVKDLATTSFSFAPATIDRYQGQKMARVLAWPKKDYAYNQITSEVDEITKTSSTFKNVRIEKGGEQEGAGDANMAILRTVPLGLIVLLMFLLIEFNSFRKVAIILLSVPLVVAGVTPGLLIGNAAFGFMSLLGVLALVGIVVNNSILLIETIDEELTAGTSLESAVEKAVSLRFRPILLTALTTIAGLLPMAFEDSTLWPPLALAMISGLFVSTILTLFVVPALYLVAFKKNKRAFSGPAIFTTVLMTAGLLSYSNPADARIYSLNEALEKSGDSDSVNYAKQESLSVEELAKAQWRGAHMPKLGLEYNATQRNDQLTQTNAFGTFEYGKKTYSTGGVAVILPLFDAPEMIANKKSMKSSVAASKNSENWSKQNVKANLLLDLLNLEELKRSLSSVRVLKKRLTAVKSEALRFKQAGVAGQSDILKIEMALADQFLIEDNLERSLVTITAKIKSVIPDFEGLTTIDDAELDKMSPPSSADEERSDLQALAELVESQDQKVSASRLANLPKVEIQGRYVHADQGLLDQKNWTEASLAVTWQIFEGGARSSLTNSEIAKRESLRSQLRHLRALSKAEQAHWKSIFQNAEKALSISAENLKRAVAAAEEDRLNAQRGKALVRDWLMSEITLEEKRLEVNLLKIKRAKAIVEIHRSLGVDL